MFKYVLIIAGLFVGLYYFLLPFLALHFPELKAYLNLGWEAVGGLVALIVVAMLLSRK